MVRELYTDRKEIRLSKAPANAHTYNTIMFLGDKINGSLYVIWGYFIQLLGIGSQQGMAMSTRNE